MSRVVCFTSATFTYLDRVRVLAATLRRHHPDWTFCLCLPDEPPEGFAFDPAGEPVDRIFRLADLDIPDGRRWTFMHDVVELCTAVKGPMLRRLLDEGASKVVYLDPDIALFADLAPIEELLDRHDLILTPHLLEPEATMQGVLDNEVSALKHGIYNLGFCAVANTPEGRRFAGWWSDRLVNLCFDDIPSGLFTDQRWCDHAPVFFPTLHVLRDPGCNVASWNVAQRPVTIEQDGSIRAAGRPLRFFHFTKFNSVGGAVLDGQGTRQRPLLELAAWYADRLAANAVVGLPPGWWAYGRYDDGTPVLRQHRRLYRASPHLWERFPDPFKAGADTLLAACDGPNAVATS